MTTPLSPRAGGGRRGAGRPTMRDVAAVAGVGLKTVSRVVNGEEGVSGPTAQRVREAIAQLGFRPNASARTLRYGVASTIGLICDDVSEPFQSALVKAVEEVAIRHRSMLMTSSSLHDRQRERELARSLLIRQADGLIITPVAVDQSHLAGDVATGTPVVFVDRPAQGVQADTVLVDNSEGARTGVRHLLARGHRRIGFLGDEGDLYTQAERLQGYRDALADFGIAYDPTLVLQHIPESAPVAAAIRGMTGGPFGVTAFFTGSALSTYALLRALGSASVRYAIVAFDDFPLADVLTPAITVIAQDPAGVGRTAAEMLFRRIAGDQGAEHLVRLRTRIILRGSGEIPPAATDGAA